ncbi:MAG: hypothetical protein R3236_11280, partial [Phycisphaeraceae bacterium]|nr:hypothetical protein [Phycisphaeraceae bacterium]
LSPNTAIQMQWTGRLDLFEHPQVDTVASTDPATPSWLTSLTYQSLTLPRRGGEDLNRAATLLWQEKLIEEGEAENLEQAAAWIEGLRASNPDHHQKRLARHRKRARDRMAEDRVLDILHTSATEALDRLRDLGVGLIILDECHHLLSHWGRVLDEAHRLLGDPLVLGLTATPPSRRGTDPQDLMRYEKFFGPVDFEVPTPALVREGFLAPYQDLCYLVRPTRREMQYLARTDRRFRRLVEQVSRPAETDPTAPRTPPLPQWVADILRTRSLPTGPVETWASFARRDPALAEAGPRYLIDQGLPLPDQVPAPAGGETDAMAVLAPLLDRYVRHGLLRSASKMDHDLARRLRRALALLGLQITETGMRPCASPVSRVLAYSSAKTEALKQILHSEMQSLGDRIRAVVVSDFEKSSAMASVQDVLDEKAGGAVAGFRALVTDPATDPIDPVLLTGSSLLVDDDLAGRFLVEARSILARRGLEIELSDQRIGPYHRIDGRGGTWGPRQYVSLVTELFQRGVTRCLVGTRGLLGEGWDAHKINVLVDLTTVTGSMSVNQLRGRSIRIDPDDPDK